MKKDIKKSSYYVWFLGAQECKNVRDVESIIPVISTLAEREKKVTPYKFTLQVSHRGLKIVHNVSALISLPGGKSSKSDLVKHLIPDHAVTCVHQDEDLVAVILLLYNPVTKWPVHVHVYRCDTVETATLLSTQLRMLVDRPENKKKLNDIESRLHTKSETHGSVHGNNVRNDRKKETPPQPPSSSDSGVPGPGHVTNLYDSLAAELKKKLGSGGKTGVPILLPPRDYDTVHRHRGNLNGIDFRRCMSANIVGVNGSSARPQLDFRRSGTKMGSSGGSSGIGSDHAPSPEQYEPENAYADNNSSSDDDWNNSPLEEPLFVKPNANDHPLPRIRRQDSGVDSSSSPITSPEKDYYNGRQEPQQHNNVINVKRQNFSSNNNNIAPNLREKYSDRNVALVQPRPRNSEVVKNSTPTPLIVPEYRKKPVEIRQRTPSPNRSTVKESPRERFKDAKEKFLMLEKERIDEQRSELKKRLERQCKENAMPMIRAVVRDSYNWSRSHHSDDDEMNRNRYDDDDDYEDDHFDHQVKNYRRSTRPREGLDTDYNGGYSKPTSNRQPRNFQRDHEESRLVPRSYSAEDYQQSDHSYRPPPPEDQRKSSPRRAAVPEAPRAAPRRNNRYTESPPPELSSRANDYKRRPASYAYEDDGGRCPPPSYGGRPRGEPDIREAHDDDDDDDGDGSAPTALVSREYKRRSAAYAYEDHHPHHHQHQHKHQHQNHHQQQELGGSGYGGKRETMSDKRAAQAAADDSPSPISPRYRHSYAEAYHRHQHQQAQPPQDSVYRHNGSLQPSGRIGIAAIHPY